MVTMRNEIVAKLDSIYQSKGFVDEDTLFNTILEYGLPLDEIERVCDVLLSKGILIQDDNDNTTDEEEVYDKSQLDYEEIFDKVVQIDETLKTFIDEVREILPPRHRETINLMPQAKSGNLYAKNRLIEMFIRVAIRTGLAFHERYNQPLADVIQNALVGLIIAYKKFEIGRQDNFSTYAPWWIRQNIQRSANLSHGTYAPVHVRNELMVVIELTNDHYCTLCGEHGICPNLKNEICEKLECEQDKAEEYYIMTQNHYSIEELIKENSSSLHYDHEYFMIEKLNHELLVNRVGECLNELREREAEVLKMRYGLDGNGEKTLEEVGSVFDVTRERIRQIESKALKRLRHPSRSRKLKHFWNGKFESLDKEKNTSNRSNSKKKIK